MQSMLFQSHLGWSNYTFVCPFLGKTAMRNDGLQLGLHKELIPRALGSDASMSVDQRYETPKGPGKEHSRLTKCRFLNLKLLLAEKLPSTPYVS